jgi:hypothetical protein
MGGSSSRGGTGGSGAGRSKSTCQDLIISTQLKSPVEEVIVTLEVGDKLDIVVIPSDGCFAIYEGKQAGKIVCIELKQLLDCIGEGNDYSAVVRSINGIRCSITISREF